MPIVNLGRVQSGSVYVDRSVVAPSWLDIPTYTAPEGGAARTYRIRQYLRGDVASVAPNGSFNSAVFTITGTGLDTVVTATPRASVADRDQELDTLILRAIGVPIGTLTPQADQDIDVVTFDVPDEKIFWSGSPGRSVNENTTTVIGLAQFIRGIPDNDFDSVEIMSKTPNVPWITLLNAGGTMAQIRIVAPEVSVNTNVEVMITVNKSDATPSADTITAIFTVVNLNPTVDAGINVVRWDVPQGIQDGATFQVAVLFDGPLQSGDTLTPADFYVDGVDGITISSVAVDTDNDQRYILTCAAAQNSRGIATFGLVK